MQRSGSQFKERTLAEHFVQPEEDVKAIEWSHIALCSRVGKP